MSALADRLEAVDPLLLAQVAAMLRDPTKDKAYQLFPLGQEAAEFLRIKRKRLTPASERAYEAALAQLALYFPTLELRDLELPAGVGLLERFMDDTWGDRAPRTYNKNLSFVSEFFKFQVIRAKMRGNPCDPIEPAKTRTPDRTIFSGDQRRAIVAAAESLRDRVALRLLFDYGLRQGSLRAVQFKHFDHQRKRLTIFSKGGKVREQPIPDAHFWMDLERLILDLGAESHHFLMPTATGNQYSRTVDPTMAMSNRAAHVWWYARLADAGIVPRGVTKGERMHKARHTAGQRILDATGNLKAVQEFLGHASIATTGDVYVGWADERLAADIAKALEEDD